MEDIVITLIAAAVAIIFTIITYQILDGRKHNLRRLEIGLENDRSIESLGRFIIRQMLHDRSFMLGIRLSPLHQQDIQETGMLKVSFEKTTPIKDIGKGIKLIIEPNSGREYLTEGKRGSFLLEGFFKVISVKEAEDGYMTIKIWYYGTTSIVNI